MATRRKRKATGNTSPLERDEQTLLFEWSEYAECTYPELQYMYHVPNEGRRSAAQAASLHLQGLKSGVPDICLPVPRGGYGALYIELKRKRGGVVSKEQKKWVDGLNAVGNKAVVCRGFEEARDAIIAYMKGAEK